MCGDKIEQLASAVEALRARPSRCSSLVIYDHEGSTLICPAPTDVLWLERQIRSVTSRGNTPPCSPGVSQCGRAAQKPRAPRFVHRVLLLPRPGQCGPQLARDLAGSAPRCAVRGSR
jgi:hypothetical protein